MNNPIHTVRDFMLGVFNELKKCSWPTRQALMESTTAVIGSMILLALFVWAIDQACQFGINQMIKS